MALQTLERYILDPVSEDANNMPLEIAGRDGGHAIYLGSIHFPEPEELTTRVGTRETEGELAFGEPAHRNRQIPCEVLVSEGSQVGAATVVNLLPNPSLELDTSTHASYLGGDTMSRDTTQAVRGGASLKFVTGAASTITGTRMVLPNFNWQQGKTYSLLAAVRLSRGIAAKITVSDDATSSFDSPALGVTTNRWTWFKIQGFTPGWTNNIVRLTVSPVAGNFLATDNVSLDAMMLVEGSTVGEYVDGDQPGCVWDGVRGASTSRCRSRVNLCPNPSFERDLGAWTTGTFNAVIDDFSRSNAWAARGEYAAHVRLHSTSATTPFGLVAIYSSPITGGMTYSFTVSARVLSLAGAVFKVNWRGTDLGDIASDQTPLALGDGTYSFTATAPADASWAYIQLGIQGTGGANQVFEAYFDAVGAFGGTVAAYGDGDTPGWSWTGTPQATTSYGVGSGLDRVRFEAAWHDLERKLKKIDREQGTLKRYLPDGTPMTFDLVGAKITGDAWDRPLNQGQQVLQFELEAKPYARLAQQALNLTTTDDFSLDTITNGPWQSDGGAGVLSVSGGQLVPTSAADTRPYRRVKIGDATITLKHRLTTASGGTAMVRMKRLDANNWLAIGTRVGNLRIGKLDGGVETTLATQANGLANNTDYWLRASIVGNVVTAQFFSDAAMTVPVGAALTYTLAGADATKFGAGVTGNPGMWLIPDATTSRYGPFSVTSDTAFNVTQSILYADLPSIPGSVWAQGLLTVQEDSGQDQAWLAWALDYTNFQNAATARPLYDAESLTPLAGATVVTQAGASGPSTNNAVSASLTGDYISYLSTPPTAGPGSGSNLSHIGPQRVVLRCYRPATNTGQVAVRLEWGEGDLRHTSINDPVVFAADEREGQWVLVDLGTINPRKVTAGTQRWEGRVAAKSTVPGDVLMMDRLLIFPIAEEYGEARAVPQTASPTAYAARDPFNQGAATMNGAVMAAGGSWTTTPTPGTNDFTIDTVNHWAQRTAVSDADVNSGKLALAGAGTAQAAPITVQADVGIVAASQNVYTSDVIRQGIMARCDGTTANMLFAGLVCAGVSKRKRVQVYKRVGSVTTVLKYLDLTPTWGNDAVVRTIRLSIDANGSWKVWVWTAGTATPSTPTLSGQDADLATGGALAAAGTVRYGLYDALATSVGSTRTYDNLGSFVPPSDAACFANRQARVWADRAERQDAAGAYWNKLTVAGDYLKLPPTAIVNPSRGNGRLIVELSRGSPRDAGIDPGLDDASMKLSVIPRVIHVPDPA